MITYDEAKLEQDRLDPKWLVVNGVDPKIHWDLKIDCLMKSGVISNKQPAPAFWENIIKYRLHNGLGYKDGIAIDDRVDGVVWDTGPLSTHFKLDEQAGCKITEIKEQDTSTGARLRALLNDNEAMEAIALEACLEQQKVINKAKVIKAKQLIIEKALVFAEKDGITWTLRQFAEHLSARGFLDTPGESNEK